RLSSSQQALTTPPDSPTKEAATSQAIVKNLKYLFGVFLEKVLDLTNQKPPSFPVSLDQSWSPPGPDTVLRVLECASAELSMANKPAQSSSVGDGFDLKHTIWTTPEDFRSFEKWASTPQFKIVKKTWDKESCNYKIAEPVETSDGFDEYAEYAFAVPERISM
ncbi:hypothetical protein N7470_002421, partial [Penicillium chermesinum]